VIETINILSGFTTRASCGNLAKPVDVISREMGKTICSLF